MVKHARQQMFGGPDQTLCGLPAEGLDTVFGCWNEGVFGEVVAFGKDGGPDEMRATTGFDCPGCVAVVAAGGGPVFAAEREEQGRAPAEAPLALTPSEMSLAKMLAAWEEWPGLGSVEDFSADESAQVLWAFGVALREHGLVEDVDMVTQITAKGRDLLDRARKAGVL